MIMSADDHPQESGPDGSRGVPVDIARLSVPELLGLYRDLLRELRSRGVIRTANAPAGDLAEYLVRAAYGGELAPPSEKSWDVRAADGRRMQVKARVLTGAKGERQLGLIRSFAFDALIVVLFDPNYAAAHAYEIPVATAQAHGRWREWQKGYVLHAAGSLLADPTVVDVATKFP
jgi:hypothetical protein